MADYPKTPRRIEIGRILETAMKSMIPKTTARELAPVVAEAAGWSNHVKENTHARRISYIFTGCEAKFATQDVIDVIADYVSVNRALVQLDTDAKPRPVALPIPKHNSTFTPPAGFTVTGITPMSTDAVRVEGYFEHRIGAEAAS